MMSNWTTPFNIRFFALTDIGLKRKRNEDAYAVYKSSGKKTAGNEAEHLFVVADGIGGNACGEVASKMACQTLERFFQGFESNGTSHRYATRIEKLIHLADSRIRERANSEPACGDMGTTLSTLVIVREFCLTAHVGDSRIYRLRDGNLSQLTTDHTFVQEMIDEGELAPERAKMHPLRNMLMHAVGTHEPLEKIETHIKSISAGDRFIICSDGLHDIVEQKVISGAMQTKSGPESAAKTLLRAALANGGKDNITIIAVYV